MIPEEISRVVHQGSGSLGPFPLSVDGTAITYADPSEIRLLVGELELPHPALIERDHSVDAAIFDRDVARASLHCSNLSGDAVLSNSP